MAVQPEFYLDLFDPFIYSPADYDHVLVAFLTVLLEGWTELRPNQQGLPVWWSPQIEFALGAIANRGESPAEARVRQDREQGKPNRLSVILGRTPQELSRDIIARLTQERGG